MGGRTLSRVLACGIAVVLAAGLGFALGLPRIWDTSRLPLPDSITQEEFDGAAAQFQARYRRPPSRDDVLSWLGESLAEHDPRRAAACFREIASTHPRYGHSARVQEAQLHLRLHHARAAETLFREFLDLEQANPQLSPETYDAALRDLIWLLGVELRVDESLQFSHELFARGVAEPMEALVLCFPSLVRWTGSDPAARLEEFLAQAPGEPMLRLAQARYQVARGELETGLKTLRALAAERPGQLDIRTALLQALRLQNDWSAIERELAGLPPADDRHPQELGLIRAQVALRQDTPETARDLCLQLLARDPAHPEALLTLADASARLNDSTARSEALQKAQIWSRVKNRIAWVADARGKSAPAVEVAELCSEAGYPEATLAVLGIARQLDPDDKTAAARLAAEAAVFQRRLADGYRPRFDPLPGYFSEIAPRARLPEPGRGE